MARYELLRERALSGDPGGWRSGLAVLQHRGVVCWLHAWHAVTTPPAAGPPPHSTPITQPAAGIADQLVEALASMALGALAGR